MREPVSTEDLRNCRRKLEAQIYHAAHLVIAAVMASVGAGLLMLAESSGAEVVSWFMMAFSMYMLYSGRKCLEWGEYSD